MTTKTYIPISEVPQSLLDYYKDEFGMEVLHYAEKRSKRSSRVISPERDVLVIAGSSDRYCPDCDEYVYAVQEIGMTWINPDEPECEWDEIEDEFCPQCQNEGLSESEDEYAEAMRWHYEEERGLDRWRGID